MLSSFLPAEQVIAMGAMGAAGAMGQAGQNGEANPLYGDMVALAQSAEAQRIAGSLFGSMHQVPEQAVSSFCLPIRRWTMGTTHCLGCKYVRCWAICLRSTR